MLRMNTFILHQVAAKCYVHTTVSKFLSNCLIYQQAQQLSVSFPIHVVNGSSATALTRELKPLEAPLCAN